LFIELPTNLAEAAVAQILKIKKRRSPKLQRRKAQLKKQPLKRSKGK